MGTKILRNQPAEEIIEALSVYVKANKELDKAIDLLVEKRSRAIYKSPSFNSPGGGNRDGLRPDKIADALANIEPIEQRFNELANSLPGLYDYVMGILEKNLTNYNQLIVMQWRYINGAKWEYIAEKTGFAISHCYKLHNQAIIQLIKNNILTNEGKTN